MNLLFVTDIFPFPVRHATGLFAYNWMCRLVGQHNISLVSLCPSSVDSAMRHVEEIGIRCLDSPPLRLGAFSSLARLIRPEPTAFSSIWTGPLQSYLLDLAGECQADVVILVGPALGVFIKERVWPCPVVFLPYDAVTLNLASRFGLLKNPIRLAYALLEHRKWTRAERVVYPKADACVAVSEQEASAIFTGWNEKDRRRMHVIPLGVDVSYYQPQNVEERENHLVITGNMSPIRLVVSLKWFMRSVLPRVRRQVPGVTLDVVGRDPHPSIIRTAKAVGGVRVTGGVPDFRPYLAGASACVFPMLLGSGVKTNLLQAMAMERTIVATSRCLSGLQASINGELAIADDEEAFAEAIVQLLREPSRRREMGVAAREFIKTHHNWDNIVNSKVEGLLRSLTGAAVDA